MRIACAGTAGRGRSELGRHRGDLLIRPKQLATQKIASKQSKHEGSTKQRN